MHYVKKTCLFTCKILPMLLILSIAGLSFVSLLATTTIKVNAAISSWNVAGTFNGWNETDNTISGASGSVTIDVSAYKAKPDQRFKMIANENGKHWCGIAAKDTTITYGQKYKLEWDKGEDILLDIKSDTLTFTISVEGSDNYLTVTESGGSGGGGSGGETGTGAIYNAKPDSTITGNENLYQIDASFYDYYTDKEVSSGWRNSDYVNSHGDWEPYTKLNNALAQYATENDVKRPLYFGNFYNKNDGYVGVTGSNLVNFFNWVNNSSGLGGYNKSVVGLTGRTLSSDKLRYYNKDSSGTETDDGAAMPLFDADWLISNGLGSVVNTKFPMRITQKSDVTYYEFDSQDAKDNIWFDNYGSNDMTVSYGAGSDNGVLDALDFYSEPKENCGYGFFPFDKHGQGSGDQYNRAKDFAFGMRVDIPFNIGENGKINNVEQTFDFTGDDDVWVYVDGVLVLDLGGDHKKAQGSINFSTKTSTVTTGTTSLDTVTRNGAFPNLFGSNGNSAFDNNDPTQTHTLTMFYMERGMIESNLKFGFNFTAVGNEFVVENHVDTTDINDGLKDDVKLATDFDYSHTYSDSQDGTYTAFNKTGTYNNGSTNTTAGSFSLKNNQSIFVTGSSDDLVSGKYYKVNETYTSPLEYSTKWKAIDLRLQSAGKPESEYTIASNDSSANSNFLYQTLDTESIFASTRVKLIYYNTPSSSSVDITKEVKNYSGSVVSDATEFPATVSVSLDGGSTYKVYDLDYTTTSSNGSTSNGTATNGSVTLKQGDTITFNGLPVGAKVKVQEQAVTGYNNNTEPAPIIISVGSSATSQKITNTQNPPEATSVILNANKILDGAKLGTNAFWFELKYGNADSGAVLSRKAVVPTGDHKGTVSFTSEDTARLTYTASDAGKTFTYYIVEMTDDNDPDIIYSQTPIKVTVEVTLNQATNTLTATPTYTNNATITNKVKTGAVNVVKADNDDKNVKGAGFTVYKSDKNGNYNIESDKVGTEQLTGTDGKASFTNLPIFKASARYTSGHSDEIYQYYTLVETTTPQGYNVNKTVKTFRFPTDGNYTYTAEITNYITAAPDTSGDGMTAFKVVGICITGFAGLALCAYLVCSKKLSRKRIKLEK